MGVCHSLLQIFEMEARQRMGYSSRASARHQDYAQLSLMIRPKTAEGGELTTSPCQSGNNRRIVGDDGEREKKYVFDGHGHAAAAVHMHGSYVSCIRIHVSEPKATPILQKSPRQILRSSRHARKNNRALLLHPES